MNSPHSAHLYSASGFVLFMLICWSLWRNEAICYIISVLYSVKHRFIKYDIRFGRSIRNQLHCFKQQRETRISAKLSVFRVVYKKMYFYFFPRQKPRLVNCTHCLFLQCVINLRPQYLNWYGRGGIDETRPLVDRISSDIIIIIVWFHIFIPHK